MWRDIVDKDLVIINPEIKTKEELFETMVNHVYNHDYVINKKKFLEALYERERMANTELISGVALPHARSNVVEKLFVCIIISKKGIDYGSEDMGPAHIIFFFGCSMEQNTQYLRLLAHSSRLLRNDEFRSKLINATTPEEIIDLLNKFDEEEIIDTEKKKYLMVLTLNIDSKSQEVITSMVEAGITNASIIEATSMSKKLAYEVPIFAGVHFMSPGKSKLSNLFIAHIDNKDKAKKLANLLRENGIDLDKKGVGHIQLMPVGEIIGSFEEELEL